MNQKLTVLISMVLLPVLQANAQEDTLKSITSIGYQNYTSVGVLPGPSELYKTAPFSLIMDHNLMFSSFFSTGITTGLEFLNETTAPLGVNIKAILPLDQKNFFLNGYLVKSFSLDDPQTYYTDETSKAKGGISSGFDIGTIYSITTGNAIFVSIGYRHSKLRYKTSDWRGTVNANVFYNRLNVRIGIILY